MSTTSFVQNIASGVDHLGLENAPIIWSLAHMTWDSAEERDAFFRQIGGQDASR